MEPISFLPHYLEIAWSQRSQTLITSLFSTIFFVLFVILYRVLKNTYPHLLLIHAIEDFIESMTNFFQGVSGWLSYSIVSNIMFIFFYILRINLIWLFGDFFVLVIPSLHHYFRPVSTDLYFNLMLAWVCVIASIIYGFYQHGFHYIEKYIPYHGMGIVQWKSIIAMILKPLDILIGLFIGMIELLGEIAKILSLSLRLFGNILAGMVLMGMVIYAATTIFHVPAVMPLLVFTMELLVSFIQAFVFSMLVLVYLRMAHQGVH